MIWSVFRYKILLGTHLKNKKIVQSLSVEFLGKIIEMIHQLCKFINLIFSNNCFLPILHTSLTSDVKSLSRVFFCRGGVEWCAFWYLAWSSIRYATTFVIISVIVKVDLMSVMRAKTRLDATFIVRIISVLPEQNPLAQPRLVMAQTPGDGIWIAVYEYQQ